MMKKNDILRTGGVNLKALTKILYSPVRFIQRSFYRKVLFSFFAIIITTVAILDVNFYVQSSRDIKANTISNMVHLTEQSAQTLELRMDYIRQDAWSFFGDQQFQALVRNLTNRPEEYFAKKLIDMENNNSFIDAILVSDIADKGKIEIGSKKYYGNREQMVVFEKEKTRLKQAAIGQDGKGAWVAAEVFHPQTKQSLKTLAYTQALKDVMAEKQPIIGVFIVELSYSKLQEWLNAIKVANQGDYYLVDRKDGRILLGPNLKAIGRPILPEAGLSKLRNTPEAPYLIADDIGGRTLVVHKELAGTDWMLVGKVPLGILLVQVKSVAVRTIVIGVISLLGAMLLAGLLSSRVLTPIKRLRAGLKQFMSGNYKAKVPVETDDEFGFLSRSFNQMTDEMNHLIRKVYESELAKKDAEIKALQSQINPHFLYNTLGTIDSLASVNGDHRLIGTICKSLAKMLRYNIGGASFSSLREEMTQIELYLSIQKIRYESRLAFELIVEPGLENIRIPKLLIQPIVENSIIHGIERLRRGGKIVIEAYSSGDRDAKIRIVDNGKGVDPQKLLKLRSMLETRMTQGQLAEQSGTSIGLVNVHSRLQLLFGSGYGLTVDSRADEGMEVVVKLMKTLEEGGNSYAIESTHLG